MSPRGIFNKTHPSLGAFVEIKNHTAAPLPSVSCAGGADPALEFIVLKHRMRLCRCRLIWGGGRDTIFDGTIISVCNVVARKRPHAARMTQTLHRIRCGVQDSGAHDLPYMCTFASERATQPCSRPSYLQALTCQLLLAL